MRGLASSVARCRPRRRVGLVAAAILIVTVQPHVEPVRWWRSARIASALQLTPDEQRAIDGLYERGLPERCRASAEVTSITNLIVAALHSGQYDDRLLRLTERLFRARMEEAVLRRRMLAQAHSALKPEHRVRSSLFLLRIQLRTDG